MFDHPVAESVDSCLYCKLWEADKKSPIHLLKGDEGDSFQENG